MTTTSPAITDREFERFQRIIYATAGIHVSHSKRAMLVARLSKRLRLLRLARYAEYLDHIEQNADELVEMLDCIATNETRFFREQKQFAYLDTTLIPEWKQQAASGERKRAVRVWSAGCSTGEEPYSVAMTLLDRLGADWEISIAAMDLSTRALQIAVNGVWPVEKASAIPEKMLKRFMLRGHGSQQGKMKAGDEIRSVITFFRGNLHDGTWPVTGAFDLILCRNVLIYFDADSRRRAIDRLIDHLAPGGLFFIGHAETLHGVTTRLRGVAPTIYRLPCHARSDRRRFGCSPADRERDPRR